MLSDNLVTNEIKNSAGTEVEFTRLWIEGRTTEFHKIGEAQALPQILSIRHAETGSGIKRRRRSSVRFDYTVMSDVDVTVPITHTDYWIHDSPVGAFSANTYAVHNVSYLLSFMASLGATTTILYDGTGNGAQAVLIGGL
jgi:hypothetical protein